MNISLVNPPAVLPDLSSVPSQRRDVAHPHHRLGELVQERRVAPRELPHQLRGGGAAREKDLVGAEEAPVCHQVLEVLVVELELGDRVQDEERLVAARPRAEGPQTGGVCRIEGGVRLAVAGLIVQPLPEVGAPRISDRVATYSHHHSSFIIIIIITHVTIQQLYI